MMISNPNSNINFSGKLNVFYFNAENNNKLQNTLIDSSSILSIDSISKNGRSISVLKYSSPEGVKKCCSSNFFPNFTIGKLRVYFANQIYRANKTGNTVDVLL